MNYNRHQLDRLVKLLTKTNGNGDKPLIHKLIRNYRLFDLTGHSKLGLLMLAARSYADFVDALNNNDDDDNAPDIVTVDYK